MNLGIIIINNTLSLSLSLYLRFIRSLGAAHVPTLSTDGYAFCASVNICFFHFFSPLPNGPHGNFYLFFPTSCYSFIYLYFFRVWCTEPFNVVIRALTNLRTAMLPTICMAFLLDFNYFLCWIFFYLESVLLCVFFLFLHAIALFSMFCCNLWLLHYCFESHGPVCRYFIDFII